MHVGQTLHMLDHVFYTAVVDMFTQSMTLPSTEW